MRQATAVTPAERRSGTITPCAPNAAAERITAPRLRGSVTPSSATSSGAVVDSRAQVEQIVQRAVLVRRHLQRDALVQHAAGAPVEFAARDLEQRQAAVAGDAHRLGDPLVGLDADRDVERGRRHLRPQRLDHRVASDQQLRTVAALVGTLLGAPAPPTAARRAAGWPLRSSAFGVGPLPFSARRTWPPEPTWAPFFDLRIAP